MPVIGIYVAALLTGSLVAWALLGGGWWALFPLGGLCGLLVTYVALCHPILTTVLTMFFGVTAYEFREVVPLLDPYVSVGTINLRLWDPMVLGIAAALAITFVSGERRARGFLLKDFRAWGLLFGWLVVQIVRGLGSYGINALGEFRTYYSQLLLVPYLMVMVRTSRQRRRLLNTLAVFSLSYLLVALVKYFIVVDVSLGVRVLRSQGALALLYGLLTLVVTNNGSIWKKLSSMARGGLVVGGLLVLLFTTHRSVWLASVVALAVLLLRAEMTVRRQVQLLLLALLASFLASCAFSSLGYDPVDFIQSRLLAFTAPSRDPTTRWRIHLWRASLFKIREMPLTGQGLGTHFQFDFLGREIITTSPHNLYLSIAVQVGLPGLLLYLAFVAQLYSRLRRASGRKGMLPSDRSLLAIGLVVLVSAHAYYVAYVLDWTTWAYVGAAASLVLSREGVNAPER